MQDRCLRWWLLSTPGRYHLSFPTVVSGRARVRGTSVFRNEAVDQFRQRPRVPSACSEKGAVDDDKYVPDQCCWALTLGFDIRTDRSSDVAVSSFFTPASEKPPDRTKWSVVDGTLLVAKYSNEESEKEHEPPSTPRKVAAFDLVSVAGQHSYAIPSTAHGLNSLQDSTLICTASGNRHSRDQQDWKWWHPSVPGEIKSLHQKGCVF